MIVAKLQGGLGNQMFQYAAARGLQDENLYLDKNFFTLTTTTDSFTARKYELGIFKNIKAKIAGARLLKILKSNTVLYKLLRLFYKPVIVSQKANEFIAIPKLQKNKLIYLDGYFQSEKYFLHIRQQLLKEFSFPQLDENALAVKKKMESCNSVSIHFRRGDYTKALFKNVHGLLPYKYYYTALEILQSQQSDIKLFIFSGDIEAVKKDFEWQKTDKYFIDFNTIENTWKDMALMSFCKHHIVANSSFSWWGAWLSQNNGQTFAPVNWFNPSVVKYNINDYIPDEWNIVSYE